MVDVIYLFCVLTGGVLTFTFLYNPVETPPEYVIVLLLWTILLRITIGDNDA